MNRFIQRAFTLVELLVVIAIIGILSGLIIVGMNSSVNNARVAKAQIFSASLRDSLLNNLISEWKFDELSTGFYSGTVKDTWGSNDGTYYAGTGDIIDKLRTNSSCVFNKCLNFDGVDDYVDYGNGSNLNIVGNITYGIWIKSSSNASLQVFFGKYTGSKGLQLTIRQDSGINKLGLEGRNGDYDSNYHTLLGTSNITDGNWHYCAGIVNGSNWAVYVDGVQQASNTQIPSDLTNAISLRMGTINTTYPFNGLIDDARVYNAAISTAQIKNIYYFGLNNLLAKGDLNFSEYEEKIIEE